MYLRDDPEADELGVDVEAILSGFLSPVQIISTGLSLDEMLYLFARALLLSRYQMSEVLGRHTDMHSDYESCLPREYHVLRNQMTNIFSLPSVLIVLVLSSISQYTPINTTMAQPARIATTVLASAAVLAGSYALYFDYQRRNNPEFRKSIRMSLLSLSINP